MKALKIAVTIVIAAAVIGTVVYLYSQVQQPVPMPEIQVTGGLKPAERQTLQQLMADFNLGKAKKDFPPSIDDPKYEMSQQAGVWLLPDDVVFGVTDGSTAYAFPQRILAWHQVVNITHQGASASVTYCPLSGTAIGYFAPGRDDPQPFGVSGHLTNSNLVLYDRKTDSYWPQIFGRAIKGPLFWKRLEEFPVVWTTWSRWLKVHPDTWVLSRGSGPFETYGNKNDPYGSYLDRTGYYFEDSLIVTPVNFSSRLPPKEMIFGVRDKDGNALAIRPEALKRQGQVSTNLGGRPLRLHYDADLDSATAVFADSGEWVNAIDAMWFAWYAYYPNTALLE